MAVSLDAFTTQFKEFQGVDATLLQAQLSAAVLSVDATVWGAKADQGVYYLAAHMLALSPFGQNARMVDAKGQTTYWIHFRRLRSEISSGFRTT